MIKQCMMTAKKWAKMSVRIAECDTEMGVGINAVHINSYTVHMISHMATLW